MSLNLVFQTKRSDLIMNSDGGGSSYGRSSKTYNFLKMSLYQIDECVCVFLHVVCIVYLYATYVHVCSYTHTNSSKVHKTKLNRFDYDYFTKTI